jgi:CDP-6-deoxy-D-xylo-4-hexulose-3-dehydrase
MRFTGQFGELPQGYDHKYVYSHFGYNLKATEMQAAVGCAQLEKLEKFTAARKKNYAYLKEHLQDLPDLEIFDRYPESDPAWFGFLMTVKPDSGFTRNGLAQHLEAANIQTRNLFAGNILRHPCFETLVEGIDYRVSGELTNTDTIMNSSLWIGLYPGMGEAKLDYMIETIRGFCI